MLSLTENGRQAREHLARTRQARLVRLFSEMSDDEVRALMTGFMGLARATAMVHAIESPAT